MRVIQTNLGRVGWRPGMAGSAELYNIVAATPGQGQGAAMLAILFEAMRREGFGYVYLFAEMGNLKAQRFYERNSFKRLAEIEGFYRHDDAVMYGRSL